MAGQRRAAEREPLLSRALITAVVGLAVALGLITTDVGDNLVPVLVTLAPIITALWSRPVVTPVADPRDNNGTKLVPSVIDTVKNVADIDGDTDGGEPLR